MTSRSIERLLPEQITNVVEYLIFLRHLFMYQWAFDQGLGPAVLEIGFGDGYGTDFLREKGIDIVAIDVDPELVAMAKQKYQQVQFLSYDGQRLPFEDNSFDSIISFQVLEHVPADAAFLQEIRRVLMPGGIAYVTTPNRNYRLHPGQQPWNQFHIREYSPEQLKSLMNTIFEQVGMFGVHGYGGVHQKEIDRVSASKNAKRNRLTALLPLQLKAFIRRYLWTKDTPRSPDGGSLDLEKYSVRDFFVQSENIENCLDLLVRVQK